jgi:hypothetical protein
MEEIFSAKDIAAFRQELSAISTFGNILVSRNYYYTVKIASVFAKQEQKYIERFQEIVLGLKKLLEE